MFVCVCAKVLDWIENHGEAFLSKHTGVGKSLHRARALQKRHEDFEEVAQVRFKFWQILCCDFLNIFMKNPYISTLKGFVSRLQEIHHHFVMLFLNLTFQNTYTNADKLLEAAEQLAQTGECDPEEIYQAAHQLEDRIQDFVRRVEQRKVLLDMSVAFHTHVKEVLRCLFLTILSQFFPY